MIHIAARFDFGPRAGLLLLAGLTFPLFWDARFAAAQSVAAGGPRADAQELYFAGKYEQCIAACQKAINNGARLEAWPLWKIRAEMTLGKYEDAQATLESALRRDRDSINLRFLGRTVYRFNGQPKKAAEMMNQIDVLRRRTTWRFADAAGRVALGRFFLAKGEDARQILELLYDKAIELNPTGPLAAEAYLATAELALAKHDYAMAANALEKAKKTTPKNPRVHYLLALAHQPSDDKKTQEAIDAALKLNPRHIDSLLFQADHLIDAEQNPQAEAVLAKVLAINPRHPLALAHRAVLAHLQSQPEKEKRFRQQALSTWKSNPEVDYQIGRKLSQKYRFAEGAAYQRRALKLDPQYLPAKTQLCQDLLRLGEEQEGWRLASHVYEQDGYNVVAHNLVELHHMLSKYRTLENKDFILRMSAHEAEIYGRQAMALLQRAKKTLAAKYGVGLSEPTVVEIFPQQKDFAVRTFGLPGGAGYLGVCFGRVITANSPASQGENPSNWQAVLWHEFCHVATLTATKNKMPRWLSEGISVYEERQANPTWGQSMTPRYREMILGRQKPGLVPVSQLSGAFLRPPTPEHLQFAYYESSLVVEYLVNKYKPQTLRRILTDLAAGMPINESLGRYAGSMELLDREFAAYAREKAKKFASGADFKREEIPPQAGLVELLAWSRRQPNNYWALLRVGQAMMVGKQWRRALTPLEKVIKLCPSYAGSDSAFPLLAECYRQLGDTDKEYQVLNQWVSLDADAVEAFLRLMELNANQNKWPEVAKNAKRMLAVNPLPPAPHRYLAQAAAKLNRPQEAIEAYRALLLLDDSDPADLHYQLALRLKETGQSKEARMHTLKALEEAPRFRAAHRLLLEIVRQSGKK